SGETFGAQGQGGGAATDASADHHECLAHGSSRGQAFNSTTKSDSVISVRRWEYQPDYASVHRDRDGGPMRVTVIGAGTMGSGIAQLTAMAGHETALVDLDASQLERARAGIAQSLERFVRKEKIDADE